MIQVKFKCYILKQQILYFIIFMIKTLQIKIKIFSSMESFLKHFKKIQIETGGRVTIKLVLQIIPHSQQDHNLQNLLMDCHISSPSTSGYFTKLNKSINKSIKNNQQTDLSSTQIIFLYKRLRHFYIIYFMSFSQNQKERAAMLTQMAFQMYDLNNDGYLQHQEIKKFVFEQQCNLSDFPSDADVKEFMDTLDSNADGRISKEELRKAFESWNFPNPSDIKI